MNDEIQQLCVRILHAPSNSATLLKLIQAVEGVDTALGTRLRGFVERGETDPHGFPLGGPLKPLVEIQYVVLRLLPRTVLCGLSVCVRSASCRSSNSLSR